MVKLNLIIGVIFCALFIFVSLRGGTIFDLGTTGGSRPTGNGARIYHK